MKDKNWLKKFLLILLALVLTMDFIALLAYLAARTYIYFIRGVEFGVDLQELLRIIKAASLGGFVAGAGCWYAYLKNERS
ncbi:hypothetical protein RIN58_00170 [Siccibacter colletis]|uniref:hypothetical protein n=1 Tax=Siccibacter colletis TaxID=1505757 RepID=UPI0028BED501|nr:hypothetical protein [Siccibacter colletis]WNN48572.1 hypothetical protein RIN58_00170 [Siccibacter colletis]